MRLTRVRPPAYRDRRALEVEGISRSYWMAPQSPDSPPRAAENDRPPPLLLAFHGLGSTGSRLAWWTGLDRRGPAAGFLCVFPDALDQIWDDHGCGRHDGADDTAFVAALIAHLTDTGAADPERVFMAGVSSGATFLERIVRVGAARADGIALVAGTARVASRGASPILAGPTAVLLMAGTADPMVPYEGGLPQGRMGRLALRSVRQGLLEPSGHEAVAPEALAGEWAAVNRCVDVPSIGALPVEAGSPRVTRTTWTGARSSGAPVVMYTFDGGGHGWPGARQYLPARIIGAVPQHFDATRTVLDFALARCPIRT